MKLKTTIGILAIFIIAACCYFIFFDKNEEKEVFIFAEITRGSLKSIITSTGKLEATSTVEVGAQVSGRIDKIFVDFNDIVRRGQLLAILDTITLAAQVRDQESNLERTRALYEEASVKHRLNESLFEKNLISEIDFITSKTGLAASQANLKSAISALERAKANLSYAFITAPISGKIVNRNVEAGQTVAASLSAPVLFTLAEDLSSMRILVSVDESDIGQIKLGQRVEFTVQAHADKKFDGVVSQIRLNPIEVQNVVNYTVVVTASNEKGLLLPGMTATVDFYIEEREDVLIVPNAALRFQPNEKMMAEFRERMEKQISNLPDSLRNRRGERLETGQSGSMNRTGQGKRGNMGRIWFLNEKGELSMGMALLGMTDGKSTEIVRSRNITEGMKAITGLLEPQNENTNRSNILNPSTNMPRNVRRGF